MVVKVDELKPYVSCWDYSRKIDYENWDPYNNWCTILYKYDETTKNKKREILGFLTYDNCHDIINVGHLNNLPVPFQSRPYRHKPVLFYVLGLADTTNLNANVDLGLVEDRVKSIVDSKPIIFENRY